MSQVHETQKLAAAHTDLVAPRMRGALSQGRFGRGARLLSNVPVRLVARVESFENIGGFVDFPDVTVRYHSVVLVSEDDAVGWKSIRLQYQGLPVLDGRRLELGQRLRFTLPAAKEGCCAPYLKDIGDVEFLGGK